MHGLSDFQQKIYDDLVGELNQNHTLTDRQLKGLDMFEKIIFEHIANENITENTLERWNSTTANILAKMASQGRQVDISGWNIPEDIRPQLKFKEIEQVEEEEIAQKVATGEQLTQEQQQQVIDAGKESILAKIADVIMRLPEILENIFRVIDEIAKLIKVLLPKAPDAVQRLAEGLEVLRNKVLYPYVDLADNSEKFMQELREKYAQQDQTTDAADFPIAAPNADIRLMERIGAACALPIIGDIYRAQIRALDVANYQALTGRGYANEWNQIRAAASIGLNPMVPLGAAFEAASEVPKWFLD